MSLATKGPGPRQAIEFTNLQLSKETITIRDFRVLLETAKRRDAPLERLLPDCLIPEGHVVASLDKVRINWRSSEKFRKILFDDKRFAALTSELGLSASGPYEIDTNGQPLSIDDNRFRELVLYPEAREFRCAGSGPVAVIGNLSLYGAGGLRISAGLEPELALCVAHMPSEQPQTSREADARLLRN